MNVEISVPEVVELFKEISLAPEKLFEMMRLDIRKTAGDYHTALMDAELTIHWVVKGMNAVRLPSIIATAPIPGNTPLKALGK